MLNEVHSLSFMTKHVLLLFVPQATVQWDPPRLQSGLELLGYKIYVDNKVLRGLQRRDTRQMVINDLVPGKTHLPLLIMSG